MNKSYWPQNHDYGNQVYPLLIFNGGALLGPLTGIGCCEGENARLDEPGQWIKKS